MRRADRARPSSAAHDAMPSEPIARARSPSRSRSPSPPPPAKRPRTEARGAAKRPSRPVVYSRRQLLRMRNEELVRLLPDGAASASFKKRQLAALVLSGAPLRGVAVTPSPTPTPVASPQVSDDPDDDDDPDGLDALLEEFLPSETLAEGGDASDATEEFAPRNSDIWRKPVALPPFGALPVVASEVYDDDDRALPTEVRLMTVTDGAHQFIDTNEHALPGEIRAALVPTSGYSDVWVVIKNGRLHLDLYYHPTQRGMSHKLILTSIRRDATRVAYALPCMVVHSPTTGDVGLAMETSGLWPPTTQPDPNSPLSIFSAWLKEYTGFHMVCLVPE